MNDGIKQQQLFGIYEKKDEEKKKEAERRKKKETATERRKNNQKKTAASEKKRSGKKTEASASKEGGRKNKKKEECERKRGATKRNSTHVVAPSPSKLLLFHQRIKNHLEKLLNSEKTFFKNLTPKKRKQPTKKPPLKSNHYPQFSNDICEKVMASFRENNPFLHDAIFGISPSSSSSSPSPNLAEIVPPRGPSSSSSSSSSSSP